MKTAPDASDSKTTSSQAGPLAALLVRLEALRQAIHAERLRRWAEEYPPGHGDREARKPRLTDVMHAG